MLNRRSTKPHSVKWVEAERELAVRGISLPQRSVGSAFFPIQKIRGPVRPNRVIEPIKT